MKLLVGGAILVAAVIVFSALTLWLIWRAIGAAFDWIILTFGNERAVDELLRRKKQGR